MGFVAFVRENARWLAAGVLLAFLSSFGQTFFISVFAGQIRAEFGLSDGDWGWAFTAGTMASAALMLWAGGLTDRFRVRSLAAWVLAALAAACVAMALNPAAWALPFVIFALRFTGQGMTSHTAVVAMARWFVANRGRALAVAGLGYAIAEALMPMIYVAALRVVSWRALWLVSAAFLLLGVPLLRVLLAQERTPQSMANESSAPGMGGRHWTRAQVLRHWLIWAILPALIAPSAFMTAFFFQQVHLAQIKGWDHLALVALFPLFPAAGVAASFLFGWSIDRLGAGRLMGVYQVGLAAGYLVLALTESLTGAAVALVLLGITSGGQGTLPNAFWAEYYGTRNIGAIKSVVTAVLVFGSAIGPGLSGALIDRGIMFPQQMLAIAAYVVLASALMAFAVARARRSLAAAA
ncbi:MAG: MFS transporter [Rhodobacteraceae bacterium]|nr:MFS transporter [Paracoccaceae bacterium]